MATPEVQTIGLLSGLLYFVIRDVVSRRRNGRNSVNMAERIKRLDDLHAPKDANGVPLWYMPRSWGETQKEMATLLRDVAENQRRTLEIIERIEGKQ